VISGQPVDISIHVLAAATKSYIGTILP